MRRREFVQGCAAACAAGGAAWLAPGAALANARPRHYGRAHLVDAEDRPLRARALAPRRTYVFGYPYTGTPCFLIDLGRATRRDTALRTADARDYRWPGGVGPDGRIVAYSAICAHQLTHPTREISFISFRAGTTPHSRHRDVIHCCSEHSQYDPAEGARVLAGPAPQPLAAILLEHDPRSDGLYAVGTLGGEMFDEFFRRFEFRLMNEHGGRARQAVEGPCTVTELERYCRQQVKC